MINFASNIVTIPNLKVSNNAAFGRIKVVTWVENEINKRVDSNKHLPDDNIRKYKIGTNKGVESSSAKGGRRWSIHHSATSPTPKM